MISPTNSQSELIATNILKNQNLKSDNYIDENNILVFNNCDYNLINAEELNNLRKNSINLKTKLDSTEKLLEIKELKSDSEN